MRQLQYTPPLVCTATSPRSRASVARWADACVWAMVSARQAMMSFFNMMYGVFVVVFLSYGRVILRVVKCPSVWRARSMKMPWRTASGVTWRPSVVK